MNPLACPRDWAEAVCGFRQYRRACKQFGYVGDSTCWATACQPQNVQITRGHSSAGLRNKETGKAVNRPAGRVSASTRTLRKARIAPRFRRHCSSRKEPPKRVSPPSCPRRGAAPGNANAKTVPSLNRHARLPFRCVQKKKTPLQSPRRFFGQFVKQKASGRTSAE